MKIGNFFLIVLLVFMAGCAEKSPQKEVTTEKEKYDSKEERHDSKKENILKKEVVSQKKKSLKKPKDEKRYYSKRFGYSLMLSEGWVAVDEDFFKGTNLSSVSTFKNSDKRFLSRVEKMLQNGKVEFFFHPSTFNDLFRENMNLSLTVGTIPADEEMESFCKSMPSRYSMSFGKQVTFDICEKVKLSNGNESIHLILSGVSPIMLQEQYFFVSANHEMMALTLSSKKEVFKELSQEFREMIESITFEK